MSVTTTVLPPAQPGTGFTSFKPLGGDGWEAPFARYDISMASIGDASGNDHIHDIYFDPRYASLVDFYAFRTDNASAVEVYTRIGGLATPTWLWQGEVPAQASVAYHVGISWSPPTRIVQNPSGSTSLSLRVVIPNVDGDLTLLTAGILLFNQGVEQRTPLSTLQAARGPVGQVYVGSS